MRATLTLVACLLLGGCGTATARPAAEPSAPAPSSPGATPQWPPHGCDQHSQGIFDFATFAGSKETRELAARIYMQVGDRLVPDLEGGEHQRFRWLVVTDRNEIRAAVTMIESPKGYLVDSAETCAGAGPGPDVSTS